jgi:hypothetical protein
MQGFAGKVRRKEITRKTRDLEIGWGCRDWIHLAQHRDKWRALVNTVMNLCIP